MSDLQVLAAVRQHLLNKTVASRIHLTLPPDAAYPLVLLELEEIWSPCPLKEEKRGRSIQARVKFKINILSRGPGMEEAALLSDRVRRSLEGASLLLSGEISGNRTVMIRLLGSVAERPGNGGQGSQLRNIYQFYDAVVSSSEVNDGK